MNPYKRYVHRAPTVIAIVYNYTVTVINSLEASKQVEMKLKFRLIVFL